MGMFNKYKFDAEGEITRQQAILETFKANYGGDVKEKPVVNIEHSTGFCSATCPNCGKVKILSTEIKTLSVVCNKCYCVFLLEEVNDATT